MILDRYLIRQFFPVFFIVIGMFVLLICLIDLFANLVRYLNYEVPIRDILLISFYYIPKSISYAVPVSLLFAAAYTLGDLFARNELASVFAAGIPFSRFAASLVFIGLAASFLSFWFQDRIVIPTLDRKNTLSRIALHQQPRADNNSDIVIKTNNGKTVYSVDWFDPASKSLHGVSIVETGEDGAFVSLLRAPNAYWTGETWNLSGAVVYRWDGGFLRIFSAENDGRYREDPGTFQRSAVDVESLPARDAKLLVRDLLAAGLPHTAALADYYHRFSFSCVSFVVMILSISVGGRFRKNILLMSLATSLVTAVVFYVMEMVSMLLARTGYIPPLAGAWFPVIFFSALGFLLLGGAKT